MKKSLVAALFLAGCTSSPDSHEIQTLQTEQVSIDRVVFATATSIPQNPPPNELVTGTVQPNGCEIVTLSDQVASASLSPDGAYWSTLAGDLGIAETEIYPYVPTN
jgi:hypothetical protein